MRRITAILFLNVFLFIIGGNYLLFCWQKHAIQHEIKAMIKSGLKDEELTLIVVPVNDLAKIAWVKPQKEFVRNGQMFDVVKKKYIDNKVYFYCFNDKKESRLISGFNKKSMNDLANRVLRKFAGFEYYYNPFELHLITQPAISQMFSKFSHYHSVTEEIPDPPPNGDVVIT